MSDKGWHRHPISSPADTQAVRCVWLHGWGQDGSAFQKLVGLMPKSAENMVFDLPGFGRTPMLFEGAGSADYAQALAQILNKGTQDVLVGHSFGARVAVQYAAQYPDRVKALVLIAGAGLKRRRSVFWRAKASALRLLGKSARFLDRMLKTQLADLYARRFGSADYRNAGSLRGTLVSVVNEDLSPQASEIQCPVLLIYGAQDTATPPEIGKRYKDLIRDADFVCLDGFGHLDILGRGAHQCQHSITTFLKRLEQ